MGNQAFTVICDQPSDLSEARKRVREEFYLSFNGCKETSGIIRVKTGSNSHRISAKGLQLALLGGLLKNIIERIDGKHK